MPNDRTYYVLCADNCKFEGMTKEQIFDAIAEATGHTPTPVDEAFITKIKEQNAQHNTKVWTGTEAEYNALTTIDPDTLYFVGGNKITPGGALTEIVPTNLGGTGHNFADFAALSDAVGSGGNWVDVSENVRNGITLIHTGCVIDNVYAYIYEKTYMSLHILFHFTTAAPERGLEDADIFTIDSSFKPKTAIASAVHNTICDLKNNGNLNCTNIKVMAAGDTTAAALFYALATPYEEE